MTRQRLALPFRGQIEAIGVAPRLKVVDTAGRPSPSEAGRQPRLDHAAATLQILHTCQELLQGARVTAIGHRVVHGGIQIAAPVQVTSDIVNDLGGSGPARATASAAQSRAHSGDRGRRAANRASRLLRHGIPSQPAASRADLCDSSWLTDAGVRRYGFHGLSYEFVARAPADYRARARDGRVVIAHLGNGASLCAVRDGRSVASTMGFTAVDGLMMGTRCGAIDPGVLLYLMDEKGMDARAIEDLIYRRSGLLGVSGISSDMRTLCSSTDPKAAEAIALFVYRIVREIGSMAAALGGLDALVFTAGIGENDPATRAAVMEGCAWLGLEPDAARNEAGAGRISAERSRVSAWVVPTDEERMMSGTPSISCPLPGPARQDDRRARLA